MSSSLPLSLLIAWVVLFGSINTHQRHAANFRGASAGFGLALQASTLLGLLVCLGLLVFYFLQVSWYWPLVLFAVGSILGGLAFGLLDSALGQPTMSILSFIAWPACAYWAYTIIRSIAA